MKTFNIPEFYRSPIISRVKNWRKAQDKMKKDFTPTSLDFGPVHFFTARHFGFCYGVENAIEIVYRTIDENPGKRIFLLSEMIHNPHVNDDLRANGVQFMMDTQGKQLIDWDVLNTEDIVVVPAFGTTIEIEQLLLEKELEIKKYDTTCPFVEKVWKRASSLGKEDYSVIIHGKRNHEETRATFSHSYQSAPALVVQNLEETIKLGEYILGNTDRASFDNFFGDRISKNFDPEEHLKKIGVINQTTMLASDTQEIANYLKGIMEQKYGLENVQEHFADTRDTLCYATNDNQKAVYGMLEEHADFALVIGGYNSSNTSHLVELCEERLPTYFISSADKILSPNEILHFDLHQKTEVLTKDFLPKKDKIQILLTSGASCPDATVDGVMQKILSFYEGTKHIDDLIPEN